MRKICLSIVCLVFLALGVCNNVLAEDKPTVVILATGGTIAGAGSSTVSGSYKAGELKIQQILAAVPDAGKIANIKYEQVSNIGSQDMNDEILLNLAAKANKYLADKYVNGIVITHGTDTMEESAYFLNLLVKSRKPVVFVGAMRSSTALSADGPLNLYNAIAVAVSPDSYDKGVMIVMNDKIYGARDCSKTNTTNVDTFQSYNSGMLGTVLMGKAKYYMQSLRKNTSDSEFDIDSIKELPIVEIVYGHEGGNANLLGSILQDGKVKGIVYAGVGDGNLYKDDLPILTEARKYGVAVVMSSRTGSGNVEYNAELDNDKLKFNTSDNLNPQKARILLRFILTKTNDYEKIKKAFETY